MIPYFVLFLPLLSAAVIALLTRSYPRLSSSIAVFSLIVSLGLSIFLFSKQQNFESSINWASIPMLFFEFGFLFNHLSFGMLFTVLAISILVFYYSIEYMKDDPGFSRYFALLSFFVFSMLGIVLSNNLLQIFIFWELVGASSYLLIGFWYEKSEAADAGKKAFITNRLGDYGFLLGIILVWATFGTLNLEQISFEIQSQVIGNKELITISVMLIFCGVLGKSAQFPLHVWLPDAMEGPTPVSALIHAATMVAAGIYLLARVFFLFSASPTALEIISYVGGFTAIFAATQAVVQTDIKRILAYSTLSQLGYMVMAIGLQGSGVAMFHLTTHAFFKALLFLCAGSIIHAVHEQDITKMGNYFKKLPVTAISFLIGALSLSGIFPLSGFWSKDEILSLAFLQNKFLFYVSLFTAFLTAFYITRACILVFFGRKPKPGSQIHEPSQWMKFPLLVLSFLSVIGGLIGLNHWFRSEIDAHVEWNTFIALLSNGVALSGILLGYFIYQRRTENAEILRKKMHGLYVIIQNGYFVDSFYNWILTNIQEPLSALCSKFEHKVIVEKVVNGVALGTAKIGNIVRKLQTGRAQTYTTVFFGGIVVILYLFILRGTF